MDDICVVGRTKEVDFDHPHTGYKQLNSRLKFMGNPEDDRKFRQPSFCPGSWNGLIPHDDSPWPMKDEVNDREGVGWDLFQEGTATSARH